MAGRQGERRIEEGKIMNVRQLKYAFTFLMFQTWFLLGASHLVDVTKIIPNIKTDSIYATNRNFTGTVIYTSSKCYALKEVADQLKKVQSALNKDGLGLLIWDAYRPLPAQWRLWNVCPDPRYVGDPRKGGWHTRGAAVDLTIVRLSDNSLLAMGTGFDDFSPKAAFDCVDISDEAKKNRSLLKRVMEKYGFVNYKNEWWHYNYRRIQTYPVLSIEFAELS